VLPHLAQTESPTVIEPELPLLVCQQLLPIEAGRDPLRSGDIRATTVRSGDGVG
jgi:hypothetical protein